MSPRIDPHLGILVSYNSYSIPPFSEKSFFKILSIQGKKLGIDVTVFSPFTILWHKNMVLGYRYKMNRKTWIKGLYPIPPLLYDRIFFSSKEQVQRFYDVIQRLEEDYQSKLLGRGLPGKWKVYNMYKDVKGLGPFIPETIQFNTDEKWNKKILNYGSLFFKPVSGSHGRGVVKISYLKDRLDVKGRTSFNQLFSKTFHSFRSCDSWLKRFIGERNYIYQPYLELSTPTDIPFDLRVLVQKNGKGAWEETGRAIRIGRIGGLTSNLHGGGSATDADKFLRQAYSKEQVEEINKQIMTINSELPEVLEEKYGPLIELGIDVGIDRQGRVWIIEANSKPGRRSFQLTNHGVHKNALLAPIRYTNYIVRTMEGV
jgi:glutathione synthase/RimK-type ligase-like ATP-grasp enzyme